MRQIGALALVLALSACGGDPEPRFDDDPTPTVAPSSAEPSKEPWEEKSPEGAVAFAEHWTATFSEAFQTGETEELQSLSAPDCDSCSTFIALIREVYDGGGTIAGQPWKLKDPGWVKSAENVVVTGQMLIPKQIIHRAGQTPSPAAATRERYIFTVEWRGGSWQTARLVREA